MSNQTIYNFVWYADCIFYIYDPEQMGYLLWDNFPESQETIPLEYVKAFATAVKNTGVRLRVHPAWLVSCDANNQYNKITKDILGEFALMGIDANDGNVIFPSGNALKY